MKGDLSPRPECTILLLLLLPGRFRRVSSHRCRPPEAGAGRGGHAADEEEAELHLARGGGPAPEGGNGNKNKNSKKSTLGVGDKVSKLGRQPLRITKLHNIGKVAHPQNP